MVPHRTYILSNTAVRTTSLVLYCCFGHFKLLPSKLQQISADDAKMAIWCFGHVHCLVVFLLLSKQNTHSQTAEINQLGGSLQHLYTLTTGSLSCTPTHKIPSTQCSEWSSTKQSEGQSKNSKVIIAYFMDLHSCFKNALSVQDLAFWQQCYWKLRNSGVWSHSTVTVHWSTRCNIPEYLNFHSQINIKSKL
jgi:hypothetical protein